MTSGEKAPLVVVCCASADAGTLRAPLDTLRGEGIVVELVSGIDDDPKRLTGTIDGLSGEGLYVLCRSTNLGRETIEQLREILLARHIPFARTLTVSLGGRSPVADRIRTGLRRTGAKVAEPATRSARRSAAPPANENTAVTRREPVPADPTGAVTPGSGFDDDIPTLVGPRGTSNTAEPAPALPPRPSRRPTISATAAPPPPPGAARHKKASPARPPAPTSRRRPTLAAPPTPPPRPRPAPAAEPEAEPTPEPAVTATAPPQQAGAPERSVDTSATAETSIVDKIDGAPVEDIASLSDPAISLSDLDFSDLDDSRVGMRPPDPADSTTLGKRSAVISGDTVIGPAPAMITGDTLTGQKLPPSLKAAAEAAHRQRQAQASAPERLPPIITGETVAGESLPTSLKEAAEAAFQRQQASADPTTEVSPTTPPAAAAASMPARPPAAPAAAPPPSASPYPAGGSSVSAPVVPVTRQPWFPWAVGGGALLLLGVVTIAAWPDDEPEAEKDTVAAKSDDAPAAPSTDDEPAAKDDGGAKPDSPDSSDDPPDEDAAPPVRPPDPPLMAALRARQVRALDILLMASDVAAPGDHAQAQAHCSELDALGLGPWRLPAVGELSSLSQANMIGGGYYWSSTAADTFGDTFMVWNERRGRAQRPRSSAVAVCVRGGVSGT